MTAEILNIDSLRDRRASIAQIEAALPEGKSLEQALRVARIYKERLWSASGGWMSMDEDERIDELVRITTKLMSGDELAGKLLASVALWS